MPRPRVRPWMLVAAIWIVPAVFATIEALVQPRLQGWDPLTWRQLLFMGGDWLVYAALTLIIFWFVGRWPVARPHIARRALFHLFIALLSCVAWATAGKLLEIGLALTLAPGEVSQAWSAGAAAFFSRLGREWLSWVFTTLPFGVIVYLTVAGIAHAFRYSGEARDREIQMARLSAQLSDARLAALQAQLNPHFLFNTLNTIAVRARDRDSDGTVQMVEQLSDLLRRTLTLHRMSEVTLEDELDLVRQYLAIEQARFPDRLRPEFDVDAGTLSAAVPCFAVQHLVENALRHGIAKRTDAGRLVITARRDSDSLVVTVEDDGPGLPFGAAETMGHGIDNTRERLRTLYGDRASLVITPAAVRGTVARLTVPFREMIHEAQDGDSSNG